MQVVVGAPMREFLTWLERCPRTYAEAMEAWRSSCPRYTVWEDALAAGLIQVDWDRVTLSAQGRTLLAQPVAAF